MQDEPRNISFSRAVDMGGVDHIGRDDQIVVEEFAAQRVVGDDAADLCRRQKHHLRTRFLQTSRTPRPGRADRLRCARPSAVRHFPARAGAPARRRPCRDARQRRPSCLSSSNGVLAIGDLPPRNREIARHHLLDQFARSWSSASSRASGAPCWRRRPADRLRWGGNTRDRCEPGSCRILLSTPVSSMPLPRHSMLRPTSAKASSTNSRTERVSPVASTKSSGSSACRIMHMPST